MAKNILVTGRPRVGKSTLIKHCAQLLGMRAGGFYTEEISGEGVRGRKGFRLVTLDGVTKIFAEVDAISAYHVGRYGIHLDIINQFGVQAILETIKDPKKSWVLIDEIGKMEEGSQEFKHALTLALDSQKNVLASIRWHDSPFSAAIKNRQDVEIYKLTVPNREAMNREVETLLALH